MAKSSATRYINLAIIMLLVYIIRLPITIFEAIRDALRRKPEGLAARRRDGVRPRTPSHRI